MTLPRLACTVGGTVDIMEAVHVAQDQLRLPAGVSVQAGCSPSLFSTQLVVPLAILSAGRTDLCCSPAYNATDLSNRTPPLLW